MAPADSGTPIDSPSTPAVRPDVPPAATADFDRAVESMRAGNDAEAELGFKQVALQYPQFAAPLVNVAILERKAGQLEQAEDTLKSAVSRESGSAVAWTELGATQRMRGEFTKAAASYEQAIAADPRYAPAWRNLGVLEDLYLEDPNRALKSFEQYKQLTGEEKPVSGWIAELRQRLGIKRPAASDSAAPGAPDEAAPQQPGAPTSVPPQGTAPQGGETPAGQPQDKAPDGAPSQGAPSPGAPSQGAPPGSPDAKFSAPGQANTATAGRSFVAEG
jgi:tetratricopeptide (TPR) repeat protein